MIGDIIAAIAVTIWLYLVFMRGGFWRVRDAASVACSKAENAPRVAIIVPARNEADVIAGSLRSLLLQDYSGDFHVFLVDDHSSDNTAGAALATAEQAGAANRLTVVASSPLPPDWTGKLWAVNQGILRADAFHPEYLWLTDADVVHEPGVLSRLVGEAASAEFDLLSWMVKLHCQSWAERAFVPAFVFFFFKLYPPTWVADRKHTTAAAAGGCILIGTEALQHIGGITTIRDALIDDCALARQVKNSGGRIALALSSESHSTRRYATSADVLRMISRTAYTQLRHSPWLLAGTVVGMALTYVAPPILIVAGGRAAVMGALAWVLMMTAFLPMLRFYRRSPLWALFLPVIAGFYAAATLYSAIQYWSGKGGAWKGRVQDPLGSA